MTRPGIAAGAAALLVWSALAATSLDAQQTNGQRSPRPASPSSVPTPAAALGDTPAFPIGEVGAAAQNTRIVDYLKSGGIGRSEARSRLQAMGMNPGLADPYFDVIENHSQLPARAPSADLLAALKELGVPEPTDSIAPWADSLRSDTTTSRIFGHDLFRKLTTQFSVDALGPVDPGYRVGPGDEVVVVLTGDVERVDRLEVSREGSVVMPRVGEVLVNGLTLDDLRRVLTTRISRSFAGLAADGSGPIHLTVTLGHLRRSVVYIVGEAERPGAYEVSSAANVLNALYQAGGPNDGGSFRNIEVRRDGAVIARVDLYDYLLHGATAGSVRLQHGDVVFIPLAGPRVSVEGAVRRPAIFEMRPTETVGDALRYAGGLSSFAASGRIEVDRIVPPSERKPGLERSVLDVDPQVALGSNAPGIRDGDIIRAFEVADERRNLVTVIGAVWRPGTYAWHSGATLAEVLDRAGGIAETAYAPRVHIFRLNVQDHSRALVSASVADAKVLLEDRDSVVVYNTVTLANPRTVSIRGMVKKPGRYPLAPGMTLEDLVLAAGGFEKGADTRRAELVHQRESEERSDSLATVQEITLSKDTLDAVGGVPAWAPAARELRLEDRDWVFIRRQPSYEPAREVAVIGEVRAPGSYVLLSRNERVSDLVRRAGGLTDEAFAGGTRLTRKGSLVDLTLPAILKAPHSSSDLTLEANDTLRVPAFDGTVLVTGAVAFEARVRYVRGRGLDYYIERAGGLTTNAQRGRISVTQANGERVIQHRHLWAVSAPVPGPGATIFVPAKPETINDGSGFDRTMTRAMTLVSTMATIILALSRL